jgi:2-iminoacetate synthase ThiH
VEAKSENEASKQEIIHLIQEAGFKAIERDTIYNSFREYELAA